MLARSKSGICGKKQIKPNMRERKRDPKVVSFRRWFLELVYLKLYCPLIREINKTLQNLNYLQNLNQIITHTLNFKHISNHNQIVLLKFKF